jgi:uncharacterized protein (DUF1330 family)
MAADEEGQEPEQVEHHGDHRVEIFSGSEPTDQALGYRTDFWRGTGQVQTLEGAWKPKRIVVTEFPNIEQARRWYDSEDYRALKALRLRTARGSVVLVEGV